MSVHSLVVYFFTLPWARRKLRSEISGLGQHPTSLQRSKLQERSNSLLWRIHLWFEVQALYIPGTALLRSRDESIKDSDQELKAFDVKLWLPSEIQRLIPCNPLLYLFEWRLQRAQASDALSDLHSNLRCNSFLTKRKKDWVSGVSSNMRAQTTIKKSYKKITTNATRYRIARTALQQLEPFISPGPHKPENIFSHFQELKEEDVRGLPVDEIRIGEGRGRLSWIWRSAGVSESSDVRDQPGLNDSKSSGT